MNCPRCKTPIGPLADPDSIVTCPGCGSRLMTRSAAARSQGGARPTPDRPRSPPPAPSATLPPTPATELRLGSDTARSKTQRDGESPPAKGSGEKATLELVLQEVACDPETQQLVLGALDALRRSPVGASAPGAPARTGGRGPFALAHPRPTAEDGRPGRRRPADARAAVAELLRANVPVRAYGDGHAALGGIAEEKPDVIALELGLGGDMGGKDLVNMIKATMEWVDIPIVLWTREGWRTRRRPARSTVPTRWS